MKRRQCQNKDCGVLFTPCPQVPGQRYCSKKECQRARKRVWNKKKFSSDPEYQEARKDAQERWRLKNPNYWKDYRTRHSEYTRRNCEQQHIRNKNRSRKVPDADIAKTDESNFINSVLAGTYKIVPVGIDMIAKTDECIVKITVLSEG